jgi:hypothetical protein
MTKRLQLLVYGPSHLLTPFLLRSSVFPTLALQKHLCEAWMRAPFPNIQNAA